MRTYREIFALREFRVLFLARCTVVAAVSMQSLALATVVFDSTGSTLLTAMALFGGPLVTLVGTATVLGANDTMGPRRAALLVPLAYAVACGLQTFPDLSWPLRFLLLALPYVVGSATGGSTMRLLTAVVPEDGFVLGRATLNIAVGVMQVVGYLVGSVLLAALSAQSLFAVAGGLSLLTAVVIRLGMSEHAATRSPVGLVARTRAVNRRLLASPVTRPVYLALWIPNGLIVGCESLFVPFADGHGSGYLFAAAASGMLFGDVVIGRVVAPHRRERLVEPLRLLLAAPYLLLAMTQDLPVAVLLTLVASVGYAASLPLQERLVAHTDPDERGQVFGLFSSGLMIGQALGAAVAGALAEVLPAAQTMVLVAGVSLLVSLALVGPLRRSAPTVVRS